MKVRPVFQEVMKRLKDPRQFMQVLLGPRQVGKTTLALQAAEAIDIPSHYVSADLATLQDLSPLRQQWEVARQKVDPKKGAL